MNVDLFIPCFVDQLFPETGFNMIKVLESLGCQVNYNPNQTCCGQPAYNAGYFKEAQAVASKFIDDFSNPEHFIVAPSASCIGMLRGGYNVLFNEVQTDKDYFNLQHKAFEFTEFLTDVLEVDRIIGAKLEGKATYHDACSALRECGIKEGPRKLLENVEDLELVEVDNAETCCGFGGTFAVKFQGISVGMAEQKIDAATNVGADYIISTDWSCLMHLDGYIKKNRKKIQAKHIVDVLARGW